MRRWSRVLAVAVSLSVAAIGLIATGSAAQASGVSCFKYWSDTGSTYHVPVYVGEIVTGNNTKGQFSYTMEQNTTVQSAVSTDFGSSWVAGSATFSASTDTSTTFTSSWWGNAVHRHFMADFVFKDQKEISSGNGCQGDTGRRRAIPAYWTGGMTGVDESSTGIPNCNADYPQYSSQVDAGSISRTTKVAYTAAVGATVHGVGVSTSTTMSSSNTIVYATTNGKAFTVCGSNGYFTQATGRLYSS